MAAKKTFVPRKKNSKNSPVEKMIGEQTIKSGYNTSIPEGVKSNHTLI